MFTTVSQMYAYFLERLNKANAGTVAPAEFDVLINGATMAYLNQKADQLEGDQRLQDTLRVLIPPPLTVFNTGTPVPGGEIFLLPYVPVAPPGTSKGYFRMVSVAVRLMRPSVPPTPPTPVPCSSPDGWVPATPLKRDARHTIKRDPFDSPTDLEPYYFTTGSQMRVVADPLSFADRALIEYLRYPAAVSIVTNVDPELPAAINTEIVDLALRRQLEVIESQRFQTNVADSQLSA